MPGTKYLHFHRLDGVHYVQFFICGLIYHANIIIEFLDWKFLFGRFQEVHIGMYCPSSLVVPCLFHI